eukprot:TRINITY_DN17189_c0_g1_i1.p1 TRINITY_DN17189_c0_g1~~TRINITY_DN17189_c0_g1_i1.p1  ORF type:complete len:530 (+),score=85.18 TRINITY_DN17189_c0_g1_i1:157-1746(+)
MLSPTPSFLVLQPLVIATTLFGCAFAAPQVDSYDLPARITISFPGGETEDRLGFFALFSQSPPPKNDLTLWQPSENSVGCGAELPRAPVDKTHRPAMAIFFRGNCTFLEKAERAQSAGAGGLLVVNSENEVIPMTGGNTTDELERATRIRIPVVMIDKANGNKIVSVLNDKSGDVTIRLSIYHSSVFDLAEALLISLATLLVVAGAFFSTADMRVNSPIAPQANDEVVTVERDFAVWFFIMGSISLIVMYFFMAYLIYLVYLVFSLGGISCLTQITGAFLGYMLPQLKRRLVSVPMIGPCEMTLIIGAIPSVTIVLLWILLRNTGSGWFFQDIIGSSFLCWMQRTLRLPNVQVATFLLSAMFFFDIFWVFISPLIFQQSVMVAVATGGGTGQTIPMLLRMPSFGDSLGNDRMLGFGDVALPGLLISFLRRYDLLGKRGGFQGYFLPCVFGYFCGLCITIVALAIMHKGQPALLYLVPCTLGLTLALGWQRNEITCLWHGKPQGADSVNCTNYANNAMETAIVSSLGNSD